jgi:DeoR family transcriptional regulator of aga operon
MSAKVDARGDKIMKVLLRHGSITVEQLMDETRSSAPSIRRDLTRLERRGLILRTHGGAALVEPLLYEPYRHDTSFQVRELRYAEEKRRIGLAAAELIGARETVGITAGTTTTQVGRALRHRSGIHVVTNAVNIGMELCNQPALKTTLTGGTMAWAWVFALVGQHALNTLQDVLLDKVFLGVTGFDLERGATTLEMEEAVVARAMVRQAREVVVVADSSKLGKVSPALICPITSVHILVTDSGITQEYRQAVEERGIRLVCC